MSNQIVNGKDHESRIDVRTIMVYIKCPECGLGDMMANGDTFTLGVQAACPHICDKCDHRKSYDTQYPRYEHERIKEEVGV